MEFEWDPEHLSDEPPLEGPSILITILMAKMKFSIRGSGGDDQSSS